MTKRLVRTIQRGEVIDDTPVDGNLVRVIKPKFLSLVGLPANQTGFKVVRSDQGENEMSKPTSRRLRRSETNPVLRLTFPEGTTDEEVTETLTSYGMSSYRVERGEKTVTATRSDLKSISGETQDIKLTAGGIVATVNRMAPAVTEEKANVALVALEFDAEKFNTLQADAWIQRNSVDKCGEPAQNSDETLFVVKRGDVADGEEVRRLQIEDGVTAVIKRDDAADVPDSLMVVVSEIAYGNWGWGQIDFNAAMADDAFCDAMDEAIYTMRDVLWNIVYYNTQPLDVKKGLIQNCLSQFGTYVNSVMDSLPRQVLVSVARSAQPTEKVMSKEANNAAGAGATQAQPDMSQYIKREDLATAIAEGIAAAEAARAEAEVKRSADEAAKKEAAEKEAEVQRSAINAAVEAATKPLVEKIEKLEGATVVRSAPESAGTTNVATKEEKKDVFRGAIPGLRVSKSAPAADEAAGAAE